MAETGVFKRLIFVFFIKYLQNFSGNGAEAKTSNCD